jgi:hypothetical protein
MTTIASDGCGIGLLNISSSMMIYHSALGNEQLI